MVRSKGREIEKGPSYPSIQSFYQREIPTAAKPDAEQASSPSKLGDGFTEEELADTQDPLQRKWNPEREYEEMTIDRLVPGPKAVTFVGRIVNLSTITGSSAKQPKAAGWHYVLVKDDSAVISIKLYFPSTPYPLRLGQLLSIWTAFVSAPPKNEGFPNPNVLVSANLFPGRVTSDHILIHSSPGTSSLCRRPLSYEPGKPLPDLMALDSYLSSGHDGVANAKILVVVKSIGAKKKISRKAGGEVELLEVMLFDNTAEVRWTLWGEVCESAREWQPGKTVLLISSPGFRVEAWSGSGGGKGRLSMQQATMVDVEPEMGDAEWLRRYAAGLRRRESLCVVVPEELLREEVVEGAEHGIFRILFRLAEIDEWVRIDPSKSFTGHINLTILEMSLVKLHRQHMLMCNECCGLPLYANTSSAVCKNCSSPLPLYLNPRILGTLLDETGSISAGKLLWSERAWEQLLGRTVQEVTEMSGEGIRWLEQRMLFLRMHLVVAWEEAVGRLVVLGMRA